MRNDPIRGRRLKQQLPYPYDQDLSKVLRGLKRRNPITRRSRQANDPVTAAYLAAAVRLIQRHLGPGVSRLAAVADGLALRALADPAAPVIDHAQRRCLLGTTVLALIAGCVERADDGDGLPLEQAVQVMVGGRFADSGR